MQVKHLDGSDALLDAEPAQTYEQRLKQSLEDARVESVSVHKPGSIITRSNGHRYKLNDRGQWERLDK